MDDLWSHKEHKDMDHQLGKKLLSATLELEKLKSEARNEMQKSKEYATQLIHLLEFAIQERDEARNQLQKLLVDNKENISLHPNNYIRHFKTHNSGPIIRNPMTKANLSVTESNSLSEAYNNYRSHISSPVESLFENIASPAEFLNMNVIANQPLVQESANALVSMPKLDQGSLIIDDVAKHRALPQRGRFLQAVLEAGPLLNTLVIAGPLPRWRNPPQVRAFDQIPSVSMTENVGQVVSYSHNNNNMACGSAQAVASSSGSSFGDVGSGCFGISGIVNDNGCYRMVKRQRLC